MAGTMVSGVSSSGSTSGPVYASPFMEPAAQTLVNNLLGVIGGENTPVRGIGDYLADFPQQNVRDIGGNYQVDPASQQALYNNLLGFAQASGENQARQMQQGGRIGISSNSDALLTRMDAARQRPTIAANRDIAGLRADLAQFNARQRLLGDQLGVRRDQAQGAFNMAQQQLATTREQAEQQRQLQNLLSARANLGAATRPSQQNKSFGMSVSYAPRRPGITSFGGGGPGSGGFTGFG
jgi:hypothetical protein